MKITKSLVLPLTIIFITVLFLHVSGIDAFAAEEAGGGWRPIYDIVMKWLNFFILAFVIVRFGKEPILNFLNETKDNIAQEIKKIEDQKQEAIVQNKEALHAIEQGDVHISKIKKKIIEEGEKKKQEIINSAKNQSKIILEKARKKADNLIYTERERLKSEMIDLAIYIAAQKLPSVITNEDNQKFLDNYLAHKVQ